MTRPPSIVDNLSANALVGPKWRRRAIAGALAVAFALLALFPREYRAAASLTPIDPAALGWRVPGGDAFADQAAVEIGLKVVDSAIVRRRAAARLGAAGGDRVADVEARLLRGGILQISVVDRDPARALASVAALAEAARERLAAVAPAAQSRLLEPPFIDPARPVRPLPLALLLFVIAGWITIELYQLRPPRGADLRCLEPAR